MFKRSIRVLLVVALMFILAGATYAFAAANTVPDSFAGDGSGAVSGYTVSNIHYVLAANPANIASVTFTLDSAATDVRVSFDGTTFHSCTVTGGTSCSCAVTGTVTVLSASNLRVIAVQ